MTILIENNRLSGRYSSPGHPDHDAGMVTSLGGGGVGSDKLDYSKNVNVKGKVVPVLN
jgi:hypothetical protein